MTMATIADNNDKEKEKGKRKQNIKKNASGLHSFNGGTQ